MTRPKRASTFSVKDIQDSGETAELVIVADSIGQRRRKCSKFSDPVDKRNNISLNESHNTKSRHHKGGGDGSEGSPQNLEEEKPSRENRPRQMAASAAQNDPGNDCQGFVSLNSPYRDVDGLRTRPEIQSSVCTGLSTRSSVSKWMSLTAIPDLNTPSLPTPSSPVNLLHTSSASIGEKLEVFRGKSARPIRADQLRCCSICYRKFSNLSSSPRNTPFMCSACWRKKKSADLSFSLSSNFQACAVKSPITGPKQENHIQEAIGRTPDTAFEIDSSDEEEGAANATGPAVNRCQSGLRSVAKWMEDSKIAYPSRTDPEAVEILASDIQRLEPLEFLNDTIIDFYIKYIQMEFLNPESGRRFYFFNSFFYKKLSDVVGKKKKKKNPGFSKVRKWTRGINIFDKDFLIIPVHDRLHWSLAIICFPNHGPGSASRSERCILHLDSMTCGHESLSVFRLLRRYLVAEWKDTFGGIESKENDNIDSFTCNEIPGRKVPVPLQENESDCGLFLLHYIRKFVESAPSTMKVSDVEERLEDLGLFGRQWFFPIEASSLRTSIQEQLQRLFAENEGALDTSSYINLEATDVCRPRNLEAEFGEELIYLTRSG
ncbi:uncharacterized protein [Physcomitrium patens]|uniref:Ubiquitin-like protease family profile domain-containing protein n=1 Tax=Physcomitrium patens TaxID=3218 RepID=A0A7I4CTE3_PHYPA|nr:uncharacterized protein LOC112277585 isoform X3 [Physcomitrium patens]|eukprot:XP_024365873.1 uncharacterized protein LOC112277585 isoform X3 [Physcomitrella patens]